MATLVRLQTATGDSILVEIDAPSGGTEKRVSRKDLIETGRHKLEEAFDAIWPVAAALAARVGELAVRPEQVQLEFGIKLSAEAGAFIAKTGLEGNFKVALTWKPQGAAVVASK